ncbi:hypothetical protein DFP72DRAFT_282916 [Ephemerocybe angulata]|uniref:Uncharacterized protein n=1 Tax=Ephemerocybe angulata TaxID=980116 RepID=A0A8H6I2P7_9AGAR|nr:hypothetical protein DFP72DRAFT_282916 [Tulosesus angulatus]
MDTFVFQVRFAVASSYYPSIHPSIVLFSLSSVFMCISVFTVCSSLVVRLLILFCIPFSHPCSCASASILHHDTVRTTDRIRYLTIHLVVVAVLLDISVDSLNNFLPNLTISNSIKYEFKHVYDLTVRTQAGSGEEGRARRSSCPRGLTLIGPWHITSFRLRLAA